MFRINSLDDLVRREAIKRRGSLAEAELQDDLKSAVARTNEKIAAAFKGARKSKKVKLTDKA
jgi:hypothetical protein